MKNVENRKVILKLQNQEVPITYAEMLQNLVNQPVKEGVSISDMRKNLTIISVIEDAIKEKKEVISFEDSHFETVLSIVDKATWAVNDIAIIDFFDYIQSLKS